MAEKFSGENGSKFLRDSIFHALSNAVLISVTDESGKISFCNDRFCEVTGYTKEELLGADHRILNSGFHEKKFFERLWDTVKSGKSWTGEIKNFNKDKKQLWVNSTIYPFNNPDGSVIFVNIAIEITEQKVTDGLYLQTANIISEISRGSPICFYQFEQGIDGSSRFNYISDSAEKIFRVPLTDIYGDVQTLFGKIHAEDLVEVTQQIKDSAKNLCPWSGDYRLKFSEDDIMWVEGHSVPQRQKDGSVLLHGTISDITKRKKLEEELVARAKMALLGEMASGIAHEINNPLTVILAKSESMKKKITQEPLPKDALVSDISKVSQMSYRIAKIVKGLKTISRDGSQDPFEKAQLGSIVKDTISLAAERFRQSNVQLIEGAQIETEIECRPTQVSQVLLNLLNNACDAVENFAEKWVKIDSELIDKQLVRISITDSGPGIPSEVAEKLMEPFFTTKPTGKGTGLGLSISNGIAEDHGGHLNLDRNCKNTRFVLELPTIHRERGYGSLVIR